MNKFVELAKPAYLSEKLTRPDWTVDISREEGPLWLNKNENLDPILNEKIRSLVPKLKTWAVNTYPETAKVYKKLARLDGVTERNLLLTNGSDGAIRSVFDVFIQPGDVVVHTEPTFAMYDVYSKMFGAKQVTVKYSFTETGPVLDFKTFLNVIRHSQPKLVCLPNPDSPSGTVISDEQFTQLLKLTQEFGALLLIDEAYYPFYPKTVLPLVGKEPNLFVARSFSKAWGAAGFRLGYLAGETSLMALVHKNRAMYEVSTYSSEILNLLLDCREDVLASVRRLEEGRNFFVSEMKKLGYVTTLAHGNFLHVMFGADEKKISDVLKDVVLFRTDFNSASCLKGFSRFSLGTKDQMQLIVDKIKSVVT